MTQSPLQTVPSGTPSPLEIIQIPSESIDRLGNFLARFIAPAVEYALGRGDEEDLLARAKAGEVQFWCIRSLHGSTRAVVVTELVDYPRTRACCVLLCAGSGLWEWKHLIRDIEKWAVDEGCTQIEIPGREGWGRVYPDYEKAYSVFVKELTYGR